MLRTILVLLLLALCGFYFYQKQQGEVPPVPSVPRTVDESALNALKQSLPDVIFEKDILPAIEQNRKAGPAKSTFFSTSWTPSAARSAATCPPPWKKPPKP